MAQNLSFAPGSLGIAPRLRLIWGHWGNRVMLAALAVSALSLALWAPGWAWALVALGVPAQMLNEYALHRFIFHLPPPRGQRAFDLLWLAHYGHHDFPSEPGLFFVPIWVSMPVGVLSAALFWGLGASVVPAQAWAVPVAIVGVGGVTCFLAYEWFHMSAHLPVRRTALERHVARLHGQHHFRDAGGNFHVTPGGALIDTAFGTALCAQAGRARGAFLTTLGMRPDDPRLVSARARLGPAHGLSPQAIAAAARP